MADDWTNIGFRKTEEGEPIPQFKAIDLGDGTFALTIQDPDLRTMIGSLDDAAWNGTGNPASLIALLKRIQLDVVQINTTLDAGITVSIG